MASRKQAPKSTSVKAHVTAPRSTDPKPSEKGRSVAQTSARSTVSGPANGGGNSSSDAATAKMAGTEALAAAFPFNAAKASEFGADAQPATGQAVDRPDRIVSGSTLTESNASDKVG